ncbi:MAG: ATP-binding cassette domain-containing protein [Tannerella sp.]|nr:ATP-binding cassette domain-containing protein [Tannerella sp.]
MTKKQSISLNISAGEFTAIVGPSGSGKTTLLTLIGSLDAPTSGNLYLDGKDISLLKEREMTAFRLHHIGTKQEGVTFVFSTHAPRIVAKARRIITLEDGKVVSDVSK